MRDWVPDWPQVPENPEHVFQLLWSVAWHIVPFAALPVTVHTGEPLEQSMLPVWQMLPSGTQSAPAGKDLHRMHVHDGLVDDLQLAGTEHLRDLRWPPGTTEPWARSFCALQPEHKIF